MTEKFYYSFNDFNNNFEDDFLQWKNVFPDGELKDYLDELKEVYSDFVRWSGVYIFDGFPIIKIDADGKHNRKRIDIEEYKLIVTQKLTLPNGLFLPGSYYEYDTLSRNDYRYIPKIHSTVRKFFILSKSDFYNCEYDDDNERVSIDYNLYKNFKFSVVKIAENIDLRLSDLRNGKILKRNEPIELKEEEEEILLNKFSTPEKIALLELLELDNKIDNITGNIAEQKYRLLSVLFGVSDNAVKKIYTGNKLNGLHRKRAKDFFDNDFKEIK